MNIPRIPAIALAAIALLTACHSKPIPNPVPPYENLLILVADYRRYADIDLYRQPIPKDISGQNIFRATIERLAYYEQKFPKNDPDIVLFTRAGAFERLADFTNATDAYTKITEKHPKSPLAPKAAQRIGRLRALQQAAQRSPAADTLRAYIDDLALRRERLAALEARFDKTPDATLARRERERIEVELALAHFRNRYVLPDATAHALELMADIIEYHAKSRLIQSHHLMLGQFYFELAQDMTRFTPPDGPVFDTPLFEKLTSAAERELRAVAQTDGYEEKIEAAALADALEGFIRRVRDALQ